VLGPILDRASQVFFPLVSRRYKKGSILLTSNRSVGEWGGVFGDSVVATAAVRSSQGTRAAPQRPARDR